MSETPHQGQPDDAMVDLVIKQITEGLSPAEQRALESSGDAASAYARDLERAVAAVTLGGSSKPPPLPAALAETLAQQAAQYFAASNKVADLSEARSAAADGALTVASAVPRTNRNGAYGWLAAAACLVLAVFGWERSLSPPVAPVADVATPPTPSVPPTPAEERTALLAKSDSLKTSLGATKDPAAAGMTGDVVWDPLTQRGFLHFTGLAANNPAVHQYQIWIFDAGRDKRYPVDGGVFDVPANATEVVIPIRATLMVRKPAAFAVTVEKPGGVVVSGREHVVALGAIG